MNRVRALARDRAGAAAVEFVVAMVPIFLVLFCFMQISKLYTANLVFQHAANVAARAAAVIVEPEINPGDNGSEEDVTTVARLALGAWQTAIVDVQSEVVTDATTTEPNGMVTTKLTGRFRCGVALGATLTCGFDRQVELTATARFPLQGARYRMSSGTAMKTPIGDLAGGIGSSICDPSSPYSVCEQ